MKITRFVAVGLAAATMAGSAQAQLVGVGITKGTAIDQMGAAIAKAVSSHAGIQMRTQAMGGTQKYIQVVNGGDLEFGIANMMQTYWAVNGTGVSEGQKHPNLRVVATLMAFRNGILVSNSSGVKKAADLKGKRVPSGFNAAPLFRFLIEGALINGGLTYKDVQGVPAVGLAQSWNLLKQGKVDAVSTGVGAGPTAEMAATVPGGVRFVDLTPTGPDAEKALSILPSVYYTKVTPNPKLAGIVEPTTVFGYDFGIFTHKGVSNDIVTKVAKAIHDHAAEIKSSAAMWATFDVKNMAKDNKVAYHPAAEAYYKQIGIWKR